MNENHAHAAFIWACHLDVQARKPGNVSLLSPGHRMTAQMFIASAQAAAAPLCAAGATVGERIEEAVRATWRVVQCNTNLGIVLLCAPLAAACESWQPASGIAGLRQALAEVLGGLTIDDARHAFTAISLAQPAGLGKVPEQDVSQRPSIELRAAMALAAGRDRIAQQYVSAHADLFERGLPAFDAVFDAPSPAGVSRLTATLAIQSAYIDFLGAWPDSHIERKHGASVAHSVMTEAAPWVDRLRAAGVGGVDKDGARSHTPSDTQFDADWATWDRSLKARHLNPGTSADLSVGTAMIAALLRPGSMEAQVR